MQTDPVRALEAVQQRGDRQRRVVGALGAEKVDHRRRAGARADRTRACIAQTGEATACQPIAEQVEGLATVAERRAGGRHRLAVEEVGAQHLVLDLEFVVGIEERRVLHEHRGANPLRGRMKRPSAGVKPERCY